VWLLRTASGQPRMREMSLNTIAIRSRIAARPYARKQSLLWILIVPPILAIPFENEVSIAGFSLAKLIIIPLLIAVVTLRQRQLFRVCRHPVMLSGAAFLVWCCIAEGLHPYPDLGFIYRVAQVFVFAALIAAVASDPPAFRRVLSALAFSCSMLALYLVYNFYGSVSSEVSGFREAGRLRDQALKEMSLDTGLNILGYTVGMGAVIALSRFLAARDRKSKVLWGGVFSLCVVGTFIPLSRGALIALVAASLLVLSRNRKRLMKPAILFPLLILLVLVLSFLPPALTERYMFFREDNGASTKKLEEGRVALLSAAVDTADQYWALGIGSGYYWSQWGARNGFGRLTFQGQRVLGPHNGFLAAWIYFGIPGLVLLLLVCLIAARSISSKESEPGATIGLLGLGFVWLLFTHSLYLKPFSVILGMLLGGSLQTARVWTKRRTLSGPTMAKVSRLRFREPPPAWGRLGR
jgi:O-antigen ligase